MRKKTKVVNVKNQIIHNIENGLSIVGIHGYLRIEPTEYSGHIYIPIVCTGVYSSETGCSMSIIVVPFDGVGELKISPCQWFDSKESIAEYEKQTNIEEQVYEDIRLIVKAAMSSQRKAKLLSYIDNMEEGKKKLMDEEIKYRYKTRNKVPASDIKELAIMAVTLQEGFTKEIEPYKI